jgi:hypothetical protein
MSCARLCEGFLSCYFWERKFISFLTAVVLGTCFYFVLAKGGGFDVLISVIGGAVIGLASGNAMYVIISESFCTSGPCDSQGPCICETCCPCILKAKIYSGDV